MSGPMQWRAASGGLEPALVGEVEPFEEWQKRNPPILRVEGNGIRWWNERRDEWLAEQFAKNGAQ